MVRLGLVVASFSSDIVGEMADRARDTASERGATIVAEQEVPGVYDSPLAADRLARQDEIDAVAVIGAVISGDTDHDQVIADAAATGCTEVSLERDTPVTLGVTGPGMSAAEARDRVGYGTRAVEAAVDLVENQ